MTSQRQRDELRRIRHEIDVLLTDVRRLWDRFPPAEGNFIGVGQGIAQGDPFLTATPTTPEVDNCKRIFFDCINTSWKVKITQADCSLGVPNPAQTGLEVTFDQSILTGHDNCDETWTDLTGPGGANGQRLILADCSSTGSGINNGDKFVIGGNSGSTNGCAGSPVTFTHILGVYRHTSSSPYSYFYMCREIIGGTTMSESFHSEYGTASPPWTAAGGPDPIAIGETRVLNGGFFNTCELTRLA